MRFLWLSAIIVAIDQATKAAVLQWMASPAGVPRSIPVVGDWLRLTFTENPGMAFGITIGPPGTVTVLSLIATCLVAGYIYQVRSGYAPYVWSLSLIFGGAVGNIIDRVFYGVLLDYGSYFTGHVVDFIHVSLWRGFVPDVLPLIGGAYIELFPIWNVADMAIVLGVGGVLLFHRSFHQHRLSGTGEEGRNGQPRGGEDGAASAPASSTAPDEADATAPSPDADSGVASEAADDEWPPPSTQNSTSASGDPNTGDASGWTPDDWPDRAT
jgi:signal peptidase II